VQAITEDENEISLRDAQSTRERPRLEGFDLDEDHVKSIEVLNNMTKCSRKEKRSSLSTPT